MGTFLMGGAVTAVLGACCYWVWCGALPRVPRAPWRWIRSGLVFAILVLAVLVYNPHFSIAGIWDANYRGRENQQRNGVSVLFLGGGLVACVELARRRPAEWVRDLEEENARLRGRLVDAQTKDWKGGPN